MSVRTLSDGTTWRTGTRGRHSENSSRTSPTPMAVIRGDPYDGRRQAGGTTSPSASTGKPEAVTKRSVINGRKRSGSYKRHAGGNHAGGVSGRPRSRHPPCDWLRDLKAARPGISRGLSDTSNARYRPASLADPERYGHEVRWRLLHPHLLDRVATAARGSIPRHRSSECTPRGP